MRHDSWVKLLLNSLTEVLKNGSPLPQLLKRLGFSLFRNTAFKTEEKTYLNYLKNSYHLEVITIIISTTTRIINK